jgi:RimJ/RimL family protein N-acetyltransferase
MNNIDLESKRLMFERLSKKHVSKNYVGWLNDSEVNLYLESGGNYTMEMLKDYVNEQFERETYFWAIILKDSNKHIGNIKIDPIDFDKMTGEYGILMGDKSSWGKGYAREASERIIKYCFGQLKLSTITLGVIEDNAKAVALYRNIGFKITEVKTDVGIYNNKWCNTLRMSLNVEDFK